MNTGSPAPHQLDHQYFKNSISWPDALYTIPYDLTLSAQFQHEHNIPGTNAMV